MLVLSRRDSERICIGDDVVITVVRSAHGKVRLGIEAPNGLRIDREEIRKRIEREGPHRTDPKAA